MIPLGVAVCGATGHQDFGKSPCLAAMALGGLIEALIQIQGGAEVGPTVANALVSPMAGLGFAWGLCGSGFGALLGAPYQ